VGIRQTLRAKRQSNRVSTCPNNGPLLGKLTLSYRCERISPEVPSRKDGKDFKFMGLQPMVYKVL